MNSLKRLARYALTRESTTTPTEKRIGIHVHKAMGHAHCFLNHAMET